MEAALVNRLYLTQPYLATLTAQILRFDNGEFILPETIFHPQGGGQPADIGFLTQNNTRFFAIKNIRDTEDGQIAHSGDVLAEDYSLEEPVTMEIDIDRRVTNVKCHSKGHLIDLGVARLGLPFEPTKGYHFQESPYVEYKVSGAFSPEEKAKLVIDIGAACNAIIQEEHPDTETEIGSGVRTIKLSNIDPGMPCLGTHVNNIRELESIEIRKITKKGSALRVCYF